MLRKLFFAYSLFAHVLFLAVYAWMAAFIGGFSLNLIPTIDSPPTDPLPKSLLINFSLALLFGLQHSIMARPTFKQWWTRFIPEPIERTTYVFASNLAMILLLWQWRPLGGLIWDVTNPPARYSLHALFAVGWLMVPAVSLLINHFDLFGTRQAYLHMKNQPYTDLPFREPSVYKYVRHPLYVGWLIAFWATPTMTATHLCFALLMTAYIFTAIPFEERNLRDRFGSSYASYRSRVGGLIPRFPSTPRRTAPSPKPTSI